MMGNLLRKDIKLSRIIYQAKLTAAEIFLLLTAFCNELLTNIPSYNVLIGLDKKLKGTEIYSLYKFNIILFSNILLLFNSTVVCHLLIFFKFSLKFNETSII